MQSGKRWYLCVTKHKTNKVNQHAMKKYVATLEMRNMSFNQNSFETIWIAAKNRKEAIEKARFIARHDNAKFVSIYMVR